MKTRKRFSKRGVLSVRVIFHSVDNVELVRVS